MSIFDGPQAVPLAPSWRCPHCRTLQPETSRCRSCLRATVTCSSCHRFRRAIGGELGYCAADHRRSPLRGDEVRSCWEARPAPSPGGGLFDEADLAPADLTPADLTAGDLSAADPPVRVTSGPPADQPRAVEATDGRLVEAPHVAPGRGSIRLPGPPGERGG